MLSPAHLCPKKLELPESGDTSLALVRLHEIPECSFHGLPSLQADQDSQSPIPLFLEATPHAWGNAAPKLILAISPGS
jgi:hypothetical protein